MTLALYAHALVFNRDFTARETVLGSVACPLPSISSQAGESSFMTLPLARYCLWYYRLKGDSPRAVDR